MKKPTLLIVTLLLTVAAAFADSVPAGTCGAGFTIPESSTTEFFSCTVLGFKIPTSTGAESVAFLDTPSLDFSDVAALVNFGAPVTGFTVAFTSDPLLCATVIGCVPPEPITTQTEFPGASVTIVAPSLTPGALPLVMTFSSDADPSGAISDGATFRVPEPADLALFGSGLLAICGVLRRKLRKRG
jgi:hypothetical protein